MAIVDIIKYSIDNIIDGTANDNLYVVLGGHNEVSNTYTQTETNIDEVKRNLIFGKKVKSSDYTAMVKRNTWVSNTAYDSYANTTNRNHFIINQNNDVYKCIWNANSTVSTSEPLTKTNALIETADGYLWKYMYSITGAAMTKFGTTTSIPISGNTSVEANAVAGTIDYVSINDGGTGFSVYNTGTILSAISNTLFLIATTADTVTNVYGGSSIYITNGTGAGTLKTIDTSYANATGKYITLSSNTTLSTDSEYVISPRISITDRAGTGFEAYTTIANGSISAITVIDAGSGYLEPTLNITTKGTPTNTDIDLLLSSSGGHGSDPYTELESYELYFSVNFLLAEDTTLPVTDFTYYQTGLLFNPSVDVWSQNTISFGASLDVNTAFTANALVIGETSSASGIVYWANTTHIKVNDVIGTFTNAETIYLSGNTAVNSAIDIIKDVDSVRSTGDLVLYSNESDGIARASNISEDIKFLITLDNA